MSIRVLVVDDSAFARRVIREVLSREPDIEVVGIAHDGAEALEKVAELRPDVVTLDLLMPDLDGLGFLRALPRDRPPSVIVVSISPADSDLAVEALQNGAVDLVTKPTALATDRLYALSVDLIAKVRAAATAHPRLGVAARAAPAAVTGPVALHGAARLVVIGTSTGGPQALTRLVGSLPEALPVPIAVALHIPAGYTASLAARLDQSSAVRVHEAWDGAPLRAGHVVLAPGGMHLRVRADGAQLVAVVSPEPTAALHRPSVDILFESAAEQVGSAAIAVVLTGMGDDGLRGARAIRRAGGRVLAESAASCVVYGMPRSVIEAGLADDQAPLEGMAALVVRCISGRMQDEDRATHA